MRRGLYLDVVIRCMPETYYKSKDFVVRRGLSHGTGRAFDCAAGEEEAQEFTCRSLKVS